MKVVTTDYQGKLADFARAAASGSNDTRVELRGSSLTAGNSWKGRLVRLLDALHINCEFSRRHNVEEGKVAGDTNEKLFEALKETYGDEIALTALNSKRGRLVQGSVEVATTDTETRPPYVTCGEIRQTIDDARVLKLWVDAHKKVDAETQTDPVDVRDIVETREMEVQTEQPKGLKSLDKVLGHKKPKKTVTTSTATTSTETSTTDVQTSGTVSTAAEATATEEPLDPTAPRTNSHVTRSIKNHFEAKQLLANRDKLSDLIGELGQPASKLTDSRVEFIKSKVLDQIGQLPPQQKLSESEISGMVKFAMTLSIKHNSAWNRIEAMKIGSDKRKHDTTFSTEMKALVDAVKTNAEQKVTLDFVTRTATEEGVTLNNFQTKFVMKEAVDRAVLTTRKQGVEMDMVDFTDIVKTLAREVEGKSQARLMTGL